MIEDNLFNFKMLLSKFNLIFEKLLGNNINIFSY